MPRHRHDVSHQGTAHVPGDGRLNDVLANRDLAPLPDIAEKDEEIARLTRELKDLRNGLERFRQESGVDLLDKDRNTWEMGTIGREMKIAADLHQRVVTADIANDIALLSQTAQNLTAHARELAEGAVKLRKLAGITACDPQCRSRSNWSRGAPCSCGAQPLSEVERKMAHEPGTGTAPDDVSTTPDADQAPDVPSFQG